MHWSIGLGSLDLSHPLYLGIVNITPDSFSDGGKYLQPDAALDQARHLVGRGARMLDVGAESTRPGAKTITDDEEWNRLQAPLDLIRSRLPRCPLSLDTRHAPIALKGLGRGAVVLNDVTGFSNPDLLNLAKGSACGLIAMRSRLRDGILHMPDYASEEHSSADAAVEELRQVRDRLLRSGIQSDRILLDPGFGFGTTFTEDQALWEALPTLPERLNWPIEQFCIGVSRKRFLAWRAKSREMPTEERDALTQQAHQEAYAMGFRVFRTHALPDPVIRAARLEDAHLIASVHVDSWRATYQGTLPETFLQNTSIREKAEHCRQVLEAPPSETYRLWALEAAGRVIGFAATGPCHETATAEIYAIYLAPEVWNHGLGQRLMTHILQDFKASGFARAELWVLERNVRARRFYEAGGWKADGGVRTQLQGGIAFRELRYRRVCGES